MLRWTPAAGMNLGEGRAKVPSEFGFDSSVTATATCSSKYARTAVAEEISGVLVRKQGVQHVTDRYPHDYQHLTYYVAMC